MLVQIVDDVGAHRSLMSRLTAPASGAGATPEIESLRDLHYGVAWLAGRLESWRRNAITGCILGFSIVPSGGRRAMGTTTV